MQFEYQQYILNISFSSPVTFNVPLTYLFRSLLGKELKFISCVLKNQHCFTCPLSNRCAYGVIFDTPIDKNNDILKGRTNASSPYVMYSDITYDKNVVAASIELTLIGKGIDYFPYVLLALQRAGESGILKDRIPYKIESIIIHGESFNLDAQFHSLPKQIYEYQDSSEESEISLILKLESPFRYKSAGSYSSTITLFDIFKACERRLNILSGFYGDGEVIRTVSYEPDKVNCKYNLAWVDRTHYSSRQKKSMQLGGVVGTIHLQGALSCSCLSLLQGGCLFNIGKSVSFGLGKMKILEGV